MLREHYSDNYKNYENYKNQNREAEAEAPVSTTTVSTTSTSTTTVAPEPGVFSIYGNDKHAIAEFYCSVIGRDLTLQVADFLQKALDAGMAPSVIMSAIQETGWAPRPSPYYLRAILCRCLSEGILTQAQWDYQQQERQAAMEHASRSRLNEWTNYPGREADRLSDFFG